MAEKKLEAWRVFGNDLHRFRGQSGRTLAELAEETGYGSSTLSKYENAHRTPKKDFVLKVEQVLSTGGDLVRSWEAAKRAEHDPDWHRKVVTSEEEASEIKLWNPALVPGMFQTPDYARHVFRDGSPLDAEEEIERLVDLRVNRLAALREMNNPRLLAILSEAVLHAKIGGAEVMRGQLEHLLDLDSQGVMRVLVLPAETPYCGGSSGPFRLLTIKGRDTVVEVEHASGGELLSGDTVKRLMAVYGELQTWALPPVASQGVISKAIGGLK